MQIAGRATQDAGQWHQTAGAADLRHAPAAARPGERLDAVNSAAALSTAGGRFGGFLQDLTLGGLVGTTPRFAQILEGALEQSMICSNDPPPSR